MKKSKATFRLCSLILTLVFLMSFTLIGCTGSQNTNEGIPVKNTDKQTPAEQTKQETTTEQQKPQETYKVKVGIDRIQCTRYGFSPRNGE
mgnify:CR=1 FL=1